MKQVFQILKRPLLTEKSTSMRENRQVVLEVALHANKKEIKRAVEQLFSVSVAALRTSIVRGKVKRVGKTAGKQSNWKKAVVSLKEGSDLDVFGTAPVAPSEEA